jgi:hypothetical protein
VSDTAAMPTAAAAFPEQPEKKQRKWLAWAIPLLAFVIGLAIGTGGSGSEAAEPDASAVTSSPAYVALKSDLTESEDKAAELEDEVAAAEERIRQATADGESRLAARAAELDARGAQLDQRETDVAAREAQALRAAPPSQSAPSPAAPAPAPRTAAPAPFVAPAPPVPAAPAPSSTYYDNCTAVRAAGADPVRVGDPGYGRHLDRDGDGVGCE